MRRPPKEHNQEDYTGTDQTYVEGWQERALGRVRSRQRLSSRSAQRKHGIYIFMDDEMKVLIDEAAHRRGISMSGFVRRATAALVAHDLGLDFKDVVKYSAKPNDYEQKRLGNGARPSRQDDGEDFGQWNITGIE